MGIEKTRDYLQGFRNNCSILLNHLRKSGVLSSQQEQILSSRMVDTKDSIQKLALLQRDLASFGSIFNLVHEFHCNFQDDMSQLLKSTEFYSVLQALKLQGYGEDKDSLAILEANEYIDKKRVGQTEMTTIGTLDDVARILRV